MRITNEPATPPSFAAATAADIEADFWRELEAIEAEAIGWTALGPGCYFHAGLEGNNTIDIVGLPSASMAGAHMVWLF